MKMSRNTKWIFFFLGLAILPTSLSAQGNWTDRYLSNFNGIIYSFTVEQTDTSAYGLLIDQNGFTLVFAGVFQEDRSVGGLAWQKDTMDEYRFSAQLTGQDSLVLDLTHNASNQRYLIPFIRERALTQVGSSSDESITHVDHDERLNQKNQTMTSEIAENLDMRLIGVWRHTESYSSSSGSGPGFSMVTEWIMVLSSDGSFEYGKSGQAGGVGGVTFDAGPNSPVERGHWMTKENVLYAKSPGGQWQPVAPYLVDTRQLMYKYPDGTNKLWEKLR